MQRERWWRWLQETYASEVLGPIPSVVQPAHPLRAAEEDDGHEEGGETLALGFREEAALEVAEAAAAEGCGFVFGAGAEVVVAGGVGGGTAAEGVEV